MKALKKWFLYFWIKQDGAKQVINIKKISAWSCVLLFISIIYLLFFQSKKEKTLRYSNLALVNSVDFYVPQTLTEKSQHVRGLTPKHIKKRRRTKAKHKPDIHQKLYNYGAPIAINIPNFLDIPARGIRMQGMLMHHVDTRIHKVIEVMLHSGIYLHEEEYFPVGTILQGGYTYPGKGRNLYFQLSKAILPSGETRKVNIRSLDFKTKQEGIRGKRKRGGGKRLLANLGGNMVGVASDVLTEREALNEFGDVSIKSNMRNAGLQSIHKTSEIETQRNLNKLGQAKEYVLLKKDTVLWVELLPINRR